MTKRCTKFKRRTQDAYFTPPKAIEPLRQHIPDDVRYWEPCAGDGAIINALPGCVLACDVDPKGTGFLEFFIKKENALSVRRDAISSASHIITNPPWTRSVLHLMIDHFRQMRPTWLLFDADWMHTKQAAPFLPYCHKIVSVGRVSWMQNGTSGFDNCAWYLFDQDAAQTEFYGKAA